MTPGKPVRRKLRVSKNERTVKQVVEDETKNIHYEDRATVTFSRGRNLQNIPMAQTRSLTIGTIKLLFPDKPTLAEYDHFYRRDEFGNHILNRLGNDVFNKWHKIISDDDTFVDQLMVLYTRLRVKYNFRLGYMMAKAHGYSLMGLNWVDQTESIEETPTGIQDIKSIRPIPRTSVKEIYYDEDINSETFGAILAYDIIFNTKSGEVVKRIPAERFIHITNEGIDGTRTGISMFEPLYDKLLIKKNMDYALGETVWKNASALDILQMPEHPKPKEMAWAEEEWQNINVKSEFIIPHGYKADRLDSNKQLNPKPYTEYLFNTIGSGSRLGRTILLGVQAGAVTGAEHNLKDYHGFISDEQTEMVEHYLRIFIELLQERLPDSILRSSDFLTEWNPTLEMDEKDWAEINVKAMTAVNLIAQAALNFNTSGYKFVAEDDGKVYVWIPDTDKGILLEGLQAKDLKNIPEPEIQLASPSALSMALNRFKLTPDEHMELKKKWELKYDRVTPSFTAKLMNSVLDYQEAVLKEIAIAWEEEGMEPTVNRLIGSKFIVDGKVNYGDFEALNDTRTFLDKLEKALDAQAEERAIDKAIEDGLSESYEQGTEQTHEAMNISITFGLDMPEVREWLEIQQPMLKNDITREVNNRFLRGIREGIQQGLAYDQINDKLKGIQRKYNEGIPRTVHKVTHEAMNKARADTLARQGETTVVYLTMRDGDVRPHHAALEGMEFDVRNLPPELSEFGCRCTYFPKPALEEIRGLAIVE